MDDGVDDPVAGEPSGDALGSGSAAPRLSGHSGTEWLRVGSHSARSWPLSAKGARRSGPRSPLWTSTRMTTVEEYLRTERLVLRRFTTDDADLLAELDSDPEVMRYITGGRATPRDEIVNEVLPAFLSTTTASRASASGRRSNVTPGSSSAGSTCAPRRTTALPRSSSGTACA